MGSVRYSVEMAADDAAQPPNPDGVSSYDELAERLRRLRTWSGVTYRELHRRVVRVRRRRTPADVPSYNTVYRCLQPGRTRVDVELVVDIATSLLGETAAMSWRAACQAIERRADSAAVVDVSDNLPPEPDAFTGRETELADAVRTTENPDSPRILTIEGMAGSGKTTLAVRAARTFAKSRGAGVVCLSANLRGHDSALPPADPAAVLDGMLRCLGVSGGELATMDLRRRSAALRASLAARPSLILLDDVESVEQVRPLLPGTRNCVVVVTSRQRLDGLDAERLCLDTFSPEESLDLLRRVVDEERIDAEREYAARIADLVGHLPLAIALMAGRIARDRHWTLADHYERLVEQRSDRRLETGVEAALHVSYDGLDERNRRALRLLALHPGEHFDAGAAAALFDETCERADALLRDLRSAYLLRTDELGRFRMHETIRSFAVGRVDDEDPPRVRREALTHLFDHYRHAALQAMGVYSPAEHGRRPDPARLHAPVATVFDDADTARAWLDTERTNLLAAAIHCGEHGWADHLSDLSVVLFRYLDIRERHADGVVLHAHAGAFGDHRVRGRSLVFLAATLVAHGRHSAAGRCLDQAHRMVRAAGGTAPVKGASSPPPEGCTCRPRDTRTRSTPSNARSRSTNTSGTGPAQAAFWRTSASFMDSSAVTTMHGLRSTTRSRSPAMCPTGWASGTPCSPSRESRAETARSS